MKIKLGKKCRGDGVIYISGTWWKQKKDNQLTVSAKTEDNIPLPIECYFIKTNQQENKRTKQCVKHFALASPFIDSKYLIIEFEEKNSKGETEDTAKEKINRFKLKWESRLNYRVHANSVSLIRDIDRLTFGEQIHISVSSYTEALQKNQSITKGEITYPIEYDEKQKHFLDVGVLKSNGETYPAAVIHMGSQRKSFENGVPRFSKSFSVRTDFVNEDYCIVARVKKTNVQNGELEILEGIRTGFFVVTDEIRGNCSPFPYRLASSSSYGKWLSLQESSLYAMREDYSKIDKAPKFSIVVPLYNTPILFLRAMIQSVINQSYEKWELLLVNASPNNQKMKAELDTCKNDERIKIIEAPENLGISNNTNKGIRIATGDYVAFLDHDDMLSQNALMEYAKRIMKDESISVLYSDEGFIDEQGNHVSAHFKSDYNIDLLRCHNYITHFLAVKANLVQEFLLRSEFDGAQDYDLVLRLTDVVDSFTHIPQVLYFWRMHEESTAKNPQSKQYADEAGRHALEEHLIRKDIKAQVCLTDRPFFYDVRYALTKEPLISILIPNKDNKEVLDRCLESICRKTSYKNYEIIIVENNSTDESIFSYYQELESSELPVKVVYWKESFNYSAINNYGAQFARGDYLLLLNNDTEVIEDEWLTRMVSLCQREDVGVVGARLLYPDDTIQHAGVMMWRKRDMPDGMPPLHIFSHIDRDELGYFGRVQAVQDMSAVTGACLLTKRSLFEKLNGLEEDFSVALNDVDYCLRVRDRGYLVVYEPHALLYHYESLSRGSESRNDGKFERFVKEFGLLQYRWASYFDKGDPYFGPYVNCGADGVVRY